MNKDNNDSHSLQASRIWVKRIIMQSIFEHWMRQRYGKRYSLQRDCHGFYCCEVVKRMYDVWCFRNQKHLH